MYSVLLVDDEPAVREGMRILIPWEERGFRIIGEAENGRTGLDLITTYQPDLVLTDIKMPGFDGIKMVQIARKNGFKGHVIILTGYSEFDFARKAVDLGVCSYLLKPVDEDELDNLVQKIAGELKENHRIDRIISHSSMEVKERVIRNLVRGKDVDSVLLEDNLPGWKNKTTFISVELVLSGGENRKNWEEITPYLRDIVQGLEFTELLEVHQGLLILFAGKQNASILEIIQRLIQNVERNYALQLFAGIGEPVSHIDSLARSCNSSEVICNKFFHYSGSRQILSFLEATVDEHFDYDYCREMLDSNHFIELIQAYNVKDLEALYDTILPVLRSSCLQESEIIRLIVTTAIEIKDALSIKYSDIKDQKEMLETMLDHMMHALNLDVLIEHLKTMIDEILQILGPTGSRHVVQRLILYIDKNYAEDLKLETLGELFHYNSAYLGKLFKDEIGQSFNTYLDTVRINNAKILLEEGNMKVYEVASAVGFRNVDYFYSKFRKYVELSPRQYLQKLVES